MLHPALQYAMYPVSSIQSATRCVVVSWPWQSQWSELQDDDEAANAADYKKTEKPQQKPEEAHFPFSFSHAVIRVEPT